MLESLFNKVAGLKAYNFIKKTLQRRCFRVNLAKCLRVTFFPEHLVWLLLYIALNLLCNAQDCGAIPLTAVIASDFE